MGQHDPGDRPRGEMIEATMPHSVWTRNTENPVMTKPLPEDLAWTILDKMLLIRRFEEAVLRLSNEKQFVGHYHLYIGQEATGAAIMTLLDDRDRIATTHRNHGHVLARGADPGQAMAEILGRATGLNGGRGGTIHLCAPARLHIHLRDCRRLHLAWRRRRLCLPATRNGAISVAFFGDGALEEGVSFEALNIASLWHLPVLFMCENNSSGSWPPGEGYPTLVHASSDLCRSRSRSRRHRARGWRRCRRGHALPRLMPSRVVGPVKGRFSSRR